MKPRLGSVKEHPLPVRTICLTGEGSKELQLHLAKLLGHNGDHKLPFQTSLSDGQSVWVNLSPHGIVVRSRRNDKFIKPKQIIQPGVVISYLDSDKALRGWNVQRRRTRAYRALLSRLHEERVIPLDIAAFHTFEGDPVGKAREAFKSRLLGEIANEIKRSEEQRGLLGRLRSFFSSR